MSRRDDELKNQEAFTIIQQILSLCDEIKEKFPDNVDDVLEIQRAKSILILTEKTFNSFIAEFAPIQVIKSLVDPLGKIKTCLEAYVGNQNSQIIYNSASPYDPNTLNYFINNILQTTLIYSKNDSTTTLSETILASEYQDYIKKFKEEALSFIKTKNTAEANLKVTIQKITDLNTKIFGIEGDQESIENSVNNRINIFLEQSSKNYESIQKYFNELLDDSHVESIKTKIQTFEINAKKDSEELNKLLLNIQKETKELRSFHVEIYGAEADKKGLKKDIDEMVIKLKEYEKTQITAHETLLDKANQLLSLTTTIGLSKAFNNLKTTFFKANILWNTIFVICIVAMLILTKNIFPDKNTSLDFSAIFGQTSQVSIAKSEENVWDNILLNFSKELPFYIPLAWLAIFASRRRSENKRLEQEYAHKEAVAITYDSYKKQIELIGDAHNKEMLLKLLDKTIDTVAYNASVTLDESKHTESTPSHELLQDIFSKVKDFTPEMIKKLSGK